MQEMRAQIQAQIKLAETLKKLSESAGKQIVTNPFLHYLGGGKHTKYLSFRTL